MYDAIHISCPHSQIDLISFLQEKQIKHIHKTLESGLPEYSFKLKNLRFYSRGDHLNIKGSVSKYTQGNNIHPLAMNKIEQAFDDLSNDIGVDVHKGRVTLLEASDSYVVQNNAGCYIDMMHLWNGKEAQYQNDGTKVFGKTTQMKFYDKIKEMKAHRDFIPEKYKYENLLRVELVKRRGLERRKKGVRKPLLVSELYHIPTIVDNTREYHKNYKLVDKTKVKNGVNMKELDLLIKQGIKDYLNPS